MNTSFKFCLFAVAAMVTLGTCGMVWAQQSSIQAQIDILLKQVIDLQAKLLIAQGSDPQSSPAQTWCTPNAFASGLRRGVRGEQVKLLQRALMEEKVGPPGLFESGYFGDLTHQAVISFQEKYNADILTPNGLSKGTGYVGLSTKSKLDAIYICDMSVEPPVAAPPTSPVPTTVPPPAPTPAPVHTPSPQTSITPALVIQSNLLANSSFESGTTSWSGWDTDPAEKGVVTTVMASGSASYELKDDRYFARRIWQDTKILEVSRGEYILSGSIKTNNFDGGQDARLIVEWQTQGGAYVNEDIIALTTDSDWMTFNQKVLLPSQARKARIVLEITPSVSNDGLAWFDDIGFVLVP